jgi:NAD(P)-dependent dehydrogenase (short-subunit alcohol dehydrogenase family)
VDLGLRGKRAAVSGGSRGIGRSIALTLADEGADVAICARGPERLAATLAEIEARRVRGFAQPVQARDGAQMRGWVEASAAALGGLDILVANVSGGGGTDAEGYWRRNFEIDLMGAVRMVEAGLPHLRAARKAGGGGGSIIVMATMAASETFVAPMAYNAVKASLITWGQQLAQKLAPEGIRVNILSPGPTMFPGSNWEMIRVARSRTYRDVLRKQPQGRMATAEEIARSAVFLASPAASWCNGAHLTVDGGWSKRVGF